MFFLNLFEFQDFATFLESCSSFTILVVILAWCVFFSYTMSDPGGKRKRFVERVESFSGPFALPFIGNALQLIFPPEEIFNWLDEVYHQWGDVVRFWVFGSPKVFVNSYDVAMELLTRKNFLAKSEEFLPLRPIAELSLPGATPEVHPIKRKLLGPGYGRQAVEESIGIFAKHATKMCERLSDMADKGSVFNVMTYTGLCSYMIGCETAFGHEIMLGLTESDYRQQIEAWHVMLVNLVHRSMQPWFKYDFVYNLTPKGKQMVQCFNVINEFANNAIKCRRAHQQYLKSQKEFTDREETDAKESELSTAKYKSFLDLLLDLQEKKELTEKDVLHELNIFIVAGYDTTGTTTAWALHFLSSYPHHQAKVVEELHEIFGDRLGPSLEITVADVKRMKYLECCIKETLRLYPVLPWLLRRTDEDICLNDGRIIPAGVDVPINTFVIHRDPVHFPKPEEYRPERYLPSDNNVSASALSRISSRSHILPFGAGPRICPGMLFAMFELKIILAHLLLRFSWESNDDPTQIKCLFQGVLVPEGGVNVKIKRRM